VLDDCQEGARRAKEIVAALQAFSRGEVVGRWEMADLPSGLERTIALLRPRLNHVFVERDYGEIPSIECMPGQIDQVFLNLLVNAVDAIGERPGRILVRTRRKPTADRTLRGSSSPFTTMATEFPPKHAAGSSIRSIRPRRPGAEPVLASVSRTASSNGTAEGSTWSRLRAREAHSPFDCRCGATHRRRARTIRGSFAETRRLTCEKDRNIIEKMNALVEQGRMR
jgi:hypothetical protein